jgi:hypothetical protein
VILLEGVAQGCFGVDGVAIAPAFASAGDVPLVDEVGDDGLRGPLGDPDPCGDVAAADVGLLGDADENVGVVGEKRPDGLRVPPITKFLSLYLLMAIGFKLIGASLAFTLGSIAGLSVGDLAMLAVLAASGSYIVVPAVVRYAIPEARPSRYFTMALAVTFPFNIVIGIPLYYAVAQRLGG